MALTLLPDALASVLATLPAPVAVESVSLMESHGRVAAAPVVSPMAVPLADNSAMDGYALRAADLPGELPVASRVTAGMAPGELAPGTAARIFTGAVLPEGADTVVMQEQAVERDGRVVFEVSPEEGANVRRRGADIGEGDVLIECGQRLTAQAIGVLASVGLTRVAVFRPLRVAVMSTGDELVDADNPSGALKPWQLYNSNRYQLLAQLAALGYDTLDMGTLADDPQLIGDALGRAAAQADCIISSGGVSVGEADYVREQIESRGQLKLWKLAIKPGKPLAFGHVDGTPVFGLPGNPVSAWATFLLVVKPWLSAAQGAVAQPPQRVTARAGFTVGRAGTREEYLRVTLSGSGAELEASLAGSQSSGVLTSVLKADGLAVVPIGTTIAEGDSVDVLLMASLQSVHTA